MLPYALNAFFKRSKTLNAQKKFNAQTIFVSNHPSAFIDPLVAANYQQPILFFATRGDIFTTWLQPVTWASHMVPIYRKAEDGADSHKKNKDSFSYLGKVLMRKKSLILFGEGYTDDVFIRSLKPIKKGPARIGFDTMAQTNWELDIKVQAVGLNYTHPKYTRSDVLVSLGDCIHLKDYKELYLENPSRAITELTRRIQKSMQEQITYVERKELAPFVENLLILSRRGMNNFHYDAKYSLESRFHFSRELALKINERYIETSTVWTDLKNDTETYFSEQEKAGINENWVAEYSRSNGKKMGVRILDFIFGLPIAIIGLVHNYIPYIIIKTFVEKTFKRSVFWSGVKMILGTTFSAIFNIPAIFLFKTYIYDNIWFALAYYLIVPAFTAVFAYDYFKRLKDTLGIMEADKSVLASFVSKRKVLIERMKGLNLI